MPRVEITLSSLANVSFKVKKVFTYDDEDWAGMSPQQRQEMINEDGEIFLNENVEWDYKVLS
jgi:hypothetical protein